MDCAIPVNRIFDLEILEDVPTLERIANIIAFLPRDHYGETSFQSCATELAQEIEEKLGGIPTMTSLIDKARRAAQNSLSKDVPCSVKNGHRYVKLTEVAFIDRVLDIRSEDTVMLLAAGDSFWPEVWTATHCREVYANDIKDYVKKKERFKYYKSLLRMDPQRIRWKKFDANKKFPYPDNFFDCVVSHSSIEHIDNWENVLNECLRITKKGGRIGHAAAFVNREQTDLGPGNRSWWNLEKWNRFAAAAGKNYRIIGNWQYHLPDNWEDISEITDPGGMYRPYAANFIFFGRI